MDEDTSQHWRRSALRALAFLLLAASPVGAPLIGYVLLAACDIPWEGPPQCFVPTAALRYFLVFTFLPFVRVGPFLAILWLMLSAAVMLACLWHAGRALWIVIMERE